MGREFIGDCSDDPEFGEYETNLIIKYLKQVCGPAPKGVDIQVTWEGCEVGNEGEETQYPLISVVWDDGVMTYPGDYIGRCIEAYERFELPEEIYEQGRLVSELHALVDRAQNIPRRRKP